MCCVDLSRLKGLRDGLPFSASVVGRSTADLGSTITKSNPNDALCGATRTPPLGVGAEVYAGLEIKEVEMEDEYLHMAILADDDDEQIYDGLMAIPGE